MNLTLLVGATRLAVPILAALALAGEATAQGAPAAPAAAQQPDPAVEAARVAFDALPEPERKAVQDALSWTGDFNGTTSGSFGRRTYEALVAYQKRAKVNPANGILDAKGRSALQAAAQKAKDAIGFAVVPDPRTGAQLGIPRKLLTKQETAPGQGGGTRWQSADGKITLDTRTYAPAEQDLAALYERLLNLPVPGRQVTYKFQRPDLFVLSGETPTGKFYIRYAAGPNEIRGYTLGYDKALAKDFDRTVIAVANSFAPFPAASGAVAAAPAAAPPARPADLAPRGPALVGSAVAVARGRAVTTAAVAVCPELRVGKARARVVASEAATRLALLEVEGLAVPAPPVRASGFAEGEGLVVLAMTHEAAPAPSLIAAPGEAASGRLVAPLQAGASGGGAFDRSGALAGLVGPLPTQLRQIAGVVPPMTHAAVPGEALAGFLAANGVTPASAPAGGTRTAGEIVKASGGAVLAVECLR